MLNSKSEAASQRILYPLDASGRSLDDARDDLWLSSASSGSGNAEWNSPENRRGPSGPGYVTLYDVEFESLTLGLLDSELCLGAAAESKLRPVLGRPVAPMAPAA